MELEEGRYLVTMRGKIPDDFLEQYIRIQPASNRDQSEDIDKYWLSSIIKNVSNLEKIWQALEIDEVNFGVKIAVDKVFATKIPKDLVNAIRVTAKWIKQGYGTDRQGVFKTWEEMRKTHRKGKLDYVDIASIITKATSISMFGDYVAADHPYYVGSIKGVENYSQMLPEKMSVEAITRLTLGNPESIGYLSFKKKEYGQMIEDEVKKLQNK